MSDRNLAPDRVRHNFRVDLFGAVSGAPMFGFVIPFLPIIVRRLGGSELDVSITLASAFVGHMLSPVLAAPLSRFSRVRVVGVTSSLARLVFIGGALLSPTPAVLAFSLVGYFICSLSNLAAYTGVMQTIYPDDQRATAMGRVRMGASIAGMAAATAGGALIQISDDRVGVLIGAAIFSLLGAVSFFLIKMDEPELRQRVVAPARLAPMVLADPAFARFIMATTVFGFGNLMALTMYPFLLVDRFDAPGTFIGLYTALGSAATLVGYHVWGRRIDRGSSVSFTVASCALTIAVPLTWLAAPSAIFVLPAAIIAGLAGSAGDLTFFANMVQLAPKGRAADYMAAQSFALGVRGTIAPFVASSLLVGAGANAVLVVGATLMVSGVILMRGVLSRVGQVRPEVVELAS